MMLALKVFQEHSQNITKVDSNILLVRSTDIEKICLGVFFLGCRPATLLKTILMNKRFRVSDCKHL